MGDNDMTLDYDDMVRSISQAYWQTLMDNDSAAREMARQTAEIYGFLPNAGDTIVDQFGVGPLQEWLGHQTGSLDAAATPVEPFSRPYVQEPAQRSAA
jgi:hypothetical protein